MPPANAAIVERFWAAMDRNDWPYAMTEFWPDPFPAAEWRARWVERGVAGTE